MNARHQLLVIWLVVMFAYIGGSIPYPLLAPLLLNPDYASVLPGHLSYASSAALLGLTIGAFPLGQLIGAPILGALSDQHGRKIVLCTSLVGAAIGLSLSAMSLSLGAWPLLVISRFITGLVEGNVAIVNAMVADLDGIDHARGFGGITATREFGFILGPMLTGLLMQQDHTLTAMAKPFWVAAIMALAVCLLAYLGLQETHQPTKTQPTGPWQQLNLIARVQRLCQHAPLKHVFLAGIFFTIGCDAFYNFAPAFMTEIQRMSPLGIAQCNAVFSITAAIGAFYAGKTFERWNRATVAAVSCLGGGVCLSLMLWPQPRASFMALTGFFTLLISVAGVFFTMEASERSDADHQGEVLGTQQGLHTLGDAIMAIGGGALLALSPALPLLCGTVLMVMGAWGIRRWLR